jgi:hypothetical protein
MRSRQALFPAEPKIESFLTNLSVQEQVTTAIQNQAMNAPMYPDTHALDHAMEAALIRVKDINCQMKPWGPPGLALTSWSVQIRTLLKEV